MAVSVKEYIIYLVIILDTTIDKRYILARLSTTDKITSFYTIFNHLIGNGVALTIGADNRDISPIKITYKVHEQLRLVKIRRYNSHER